MKKILIVVLLVFVIIGILTVLKTNKDIERLNNNIKINLSERDFVGLTPEQATTKSETEDIPFRVVMIDGQLQPTTRDFREGRVNAEVTEGIITSYTIEANTIVSPEDNQIIDEEVVEQRKEPETQESLYPNLIGLTVEEAQNFAETEGVAFRIGSIDGEPRPVTMDYRIGRITAAVENNIVTDYSVEQ